MFSLIMPLDTNRLEQFKVTKRLYDKMPQVKEFLIPTRNYQAVKEYLSAFDLMKNVKLLAYKTEEGFNPSKALNIATRKAQYERVIVTSPEVKPTGDVLFQLEELIGGNVICQVFDESPEGELTSLVNSGYRAQSPAMYFLAMFNKSDIETINGWDEDFMKGYAYEDDDFGARWMRARLTFTLREDIQGVHQYHPRSETIPGGTGINFAKYNQNNDNEVIKCVNGLEKMLV